MECFIVLSEELEGRIDADYYRSSNSLSIKELKYTSVCFDQLIEQITKGETPLWRGGTYQNKGVAFLRVQNIKEEGISGNMNFISQEIDNRMKRSQLFGNEILYTMAGTIGVATLFPKTFGRANINQAIAKIVLKKGVNKEYIVYILNSNICKSQSLKFLTASAQPNINFEQIKSILIPLPSTEIQNQIVQLMENAYSQKKQKETEAKQLLDSIGEYILQELKISQNAIINLPTPRLSKSGGLYSGEQQMTYFIMNSKEIANSNMIDVRYFLPKYRMATEYLKKSTYTSVELGSLVKDEIHRGKTPKYSKGGIPVIKIANIQNGKLFSAEEFVTQEFFASSARASVKENDVLLASTGEGSIGKVATYSSNEPAIADNHISIITLDLTKANPEYVAIFLQSIFGILQMERAVSGATGQRELYPTEIKKIQIPAPPLPIQNKIAEEVKRRIQKADQLQKEAIEGLEKAKKEVEKILFE